MRKDYADEFVDSGKCPKCGGGFSIAAADSIRGTYLIRCRFCNAIWKDAKKLLTEMQSKQGVIQARDSKKVSLPGRFPKIQPQVIHARKQPNKVLRFVKKLPKDAPLNVLSKKLDEIIREIRLAKRGDKTSIREAAKILKAQRNIVTALVKRYDALQEDDYIERLQTVRLLGGLQHPKSLLFLRKVVSKPLPPKKKSLTTSHRLSPRDYEEIIMMKAIEGIGYLRDDEAYKALLEIMVNHESQKVRIAAIDSYMWNQNDSITAAQILHDTLPPTYQKYVERPRFHRLMNRDEFNRKLTAWMKKWGES